MDWIQFSIFFMGVFGLWLWNRTEARADRREACADRRDILNLIRAIETEMKDFHARLCVIEERKK